MNIFVADITQMASAANQALPSPSTSSVVMREIRRFGETTSIRGISRVFRSSPRTLGVMWLLAVIICGVVLGYQLTLVFMSYFDFDYTTELKEDNSPSVSEPNMMIMMMIAFCFCRIAIVFFLDRIFVIKFTHLITLNVNNAVKCTLLFSGNFSFLTGGFYAESCRFKNCL